MSKSVLKNVGIRVYLYVVLFCALAFFVCNNYKSIIKASAPKLTESSAAFLCLAEAPVIEPVKINFQDDKTSPPPGWRKDIGEPFGFRPDIYEGSQLQYGWKRRADSKPVDLRGNARARTEPEDVLLSTFVHMQANNISSFLYGVFQGEKTEAYWEIKLLNGVYKVTVAVGDGEVGKAYENNCINVEGVKAISNFQPLGRIRSPGRFKTATVNVTVSDGFLTLDADGGTNTKICYVEIEPVNLVPYVYLSANSQNLLIENTNNVAKVCSLQLKNSLKSDIAYSVSTSYTGNAKSWLKILPRKSANDTLLYLDYSSARKLPVGNYAATVNVSADGFSSAAIALELRVVDHNRPYVISSNPVNGAQIVNNLSIAANNLFVPAVNGFKGGVDNATINNKTVKLLKISDGEISAIPGTVQGTGGGDAISFSPLRPLDANAVYKFIITSGVKSYNGASFLPFETTFSTETASVDSSNLIKASFTKISIPGTQNKKYTSLTFGPDGRFYALKIDGSIERFDVDHNRGMLKNMQVINTLVKKHGETTAIGLTFDIKSTAHDLIAWVSFSSSGLVSAPMFDGNISRLSGINLQNEQLVVTKLPRSTRDHMVNSMAFGPDSALYISVGSNSSAGEYDKGWQRDETLLAGTILRLDTKKLKGVKLPLNVETTANQNLINHASATSLKLPDGTYNPYSINAPLTIYASGIRNAYDMVWHSNGQLYVPANGSGGGGNSPASVKGTRRPDGTFYNGPNVIATMNVPVQHDWLFRIDPDKPVGFFGHPNPLRGEYVINRGYSDNPVYPPATKADANYRGAAFDFGFNKSPNGVIEYKNNAFNGALKGKLLVCRFSGGGDIMVLEPGSMVKDNNRAHSRDGHLYDIIHAATGASNYGLEGMTGFANPLDIAEDVINGNLYISEFNWNDNPNLISQITLLRVNKKTDDQSIARALVSRRN
ncbi:Ig-like domain-containing protein [Mucilaginibacter pocheonensis]|uniref:Glucose/arabinose dehydrogenase n=1 Tax=Mucilaginibacter pocheonensis TaxID=398050 RepID=A0ABU1TFX5_9SPHI|nr:Ig-like domain-containing protein [Mucilaginibacter pocheonensis]MDR6944298.1 glucose/arabinose dehydrogenase [Mucilaginibacter pocheonensis]